MKIKRKMRRKRGKRKAQMKIKSTKRGLKRKLKSRGKRKRKQKRSIKRREYKKKPIQITAKGESENGVRLQMAAVGGEAYNPIYPDVYHNSGW